MKFLKISLITIISVISIFYLMFLFIIPNVVDINKYESQIQKLVQENSQFKINTKNLKISTGWNLSAGIKAERIDLFYSNDEKFAQVKDLEVKLSLIPLVFKKIQLDSINVGNFILRMKVQKDGSFYIEKFLMSNDETLKSIETPQEVENAGLPFGFEFSENMPLVNVQKYAISLIDMQTNKFYTLEGDKFAVSDFVLGKRIKIEALGSAIFDKQKQMTYDLNIASKFLPEFEISEEKSEVSQPFNIISVLKILKAMDLRFDVKSNLVLKNSLENLKIDGELNVSNLTMNVKGKKLPASNANLIFKDDKISVNSDLNINKFENINTNGYFKFGKNKYLDLKVKSDKIDLANVFNIVNSLLPILGIEDINGVSANGTLKADFSVKSDFKKITSDGYLDIDNANIFYNLYNITIRNIDSHIDFSKNQIDITDTKALVNGAPISLVGKINTNAYANLKLSANKLPVKGLLATFGLLNVLNENNINSGTITLNAAMKGNLTKTKPMIDVSLDNINIYNKSLKATLILLNVKSNITIDKDNKILGEVGVNNAEVKSSQCGLISLPSLKLTFDEKNINVLPSALYFNNSKFDIKGKISDYIDEKKNALNLEVYGLVVANDIKNLIPKEFGVSAIGKLPIIIKIDGNLKEQNINVQMLANKTNYVSLININSGKTSLINVAMKLANNTLKINDISLNYLNSNIGLSEDFKANMKTATPIAVVKGSVNNIQTKYPYISNLSVKIPQQITFSIPMFKNSSIQLNGDLNVNGSIQAPVITGYLNIPSVSLPTFKTLIKGLNLNFSKYSINLNCSNMIVDDSDMNFTAVVDSNFAKGIKIKSMNLNAGVINLDSLIVALSKLPQNSVGQGTDLGVTLANGKGKINTFKMAGLTATDAVAKFVINKNVLKLSDITANAYGGKIAGTADYNIIFGNLGLNLQGRTLSVEPALRAFTGMKNLLDGFLDFDAENLKLVAGTETQMMQSLKGNVKFIVSDGQMGTLGKLENLLYAQNILGNNILKTSVGAVAKAVSIKKTGDFKYIKGTLDFGYGWADIKSIQTSGPAMSMFVKGKYNLLNNNVNIIVLGRLANDVVEILGPIGDLSVNKLLSYIPKFGNVTSNLVNQMTTNRNQEDLSNLPNLTPKQTGETKEFKVSISGPVDSTGSIKYFKWVSNLQIQQTTSENTTQTEVSTQTTTQVQTSTQIPTSVDQLIDNKLKEATKGLVKKFIPSSNDTTTVPSVQQQTLPTTKSGIADFINDLPDLNTQ